jgi:hypothetical protein
MIWYDFISVENTPSASMLKSAMTIMTSRRVKPAIRRRRRG